MIDDVRLPEKWSNGSSGGPAFLTGQVRLAGGDVHRTRQWQDPLHRWDIAHNIKRPEDIADLRAFHMARAGAHRGFLFKDWLDYTSAADGGTAPTALDQPLGIGDGATTDFQLVKRYADTINPYDRPIAWPVTGTLVVAADGTPIGSGVSVDRGTGIVTITPAPAAAVVLTAGFEFDVPVHFEDDWLSITFDTINSRSAQAIVIEELRAEP